MKVIVQTWGLPGDTLEDKFVSAKEIGLDGIEYNLPGSGEPAALIKEAMELGDKYGLYPLVAGGGYTGWLGDFDEEKRQGAVKAACEKILALKGSSIRGYLAPAAYGMHSARLPRPKAPRTKEQDREILIDSFSRVAEAAEKAGVDIYIEPLNRYEDHMINTVAGAAEIIDAVGSERVRIMGDFFHMNIEERSIPETLVKYQKYLKHFHLSDSNRFMPGMGHTDFTNPLRMIAQLIPDATLSYECSYPADKKQALIENVAYVRSLYR